MALRRSHLIPAFLVLWVFAWHGRALTGYFYGDDWFQITPRSLGTILSTFAGDWNMGDRGQGGFYRPLVRVSFGIDGWIWGERPFGYHLTGLLLLAVNTLLVWALGRRILYSDGLAAAAAMGFVVLPIQSEVAWWVSTRADLLATAAVLGALTLWLRPPLNRNSSRSRASREPGLNAASEHESSDEFLIDRTTGFPPSSSRRAAAWGVASLGLLSKEIALAALVLLPLADAFLLCRAGESSAEPGKDSPNPDTPSDATRPPVPPFPWATWLLRAVLPAAVIGAFYLAWRTWSLGGIGGYLASGTEPMTLGRVADTYRQFLSGLSWSPGQEGLYGAHWMAWIAIFGGGLILSRFRRDLTLATAGVILSVAPMAGLGLSPLAGGRYLLLPGAFGLLAWAALTPRGWRRPSNPLRWMPPVALVLFSLLWTPVLLRGASLWIEATDPSRRALEETWAVLDALPPDAPGQVGVVPAPIPHGYHVWAAGYAMPVALHAHSLYQGWQARWVELDNPYPAPIQLTRPDGKVIRSWFMIPPSLDVGALVLTVASDGSVRSSTVAEALHRDWFAADLANWKPEGPGWVRAMQLASDANSETASAGSFDGSLDPMTSDTLPLVVVGPDFWLVQPPAPESTQSESKSQPPSSRADWVVIGITADWNRRGSAWLDSADPAVAGRADTLPSALPVPPMALYDTAYGHAASVPWPGRWRLSPIDRPARVDLQALELTAYWLSPASPVSPPSPGMLDESPSPR